MTTQPLIDDPPRRRMPGRPFAGALSSYRVLGLAGCGLVAVGGVLAGVAPVRDELAELPGVRQLKTSTTASVLVVYAGLTLLLIAWWQIGRLVRRPDGPSTTDLAVTTAWWAVPFLLATPIFSGDVYSYLAQGGMTTAGIDAYRTGPAALGGPLTVNVPDIWLHTPAPYGPIFLDLTGVVNEATGVSVRAGVVGMRILALAGVGLLMWSVPRLAEYCGVRPAAAVWLGVLNPLVLLHLVADAHNDALMLGLMLSGLVLALRRRHLLATVVITVGALIKAPAALAVAFVVPVWAARLDGRGRRARAGLAAAGAVAATAVVVTAATGTGFGWIGALGTPTRARTWMSVTTDVGFVAGTLAHHLGVASVDATRTACWLAGLAAAGCLTLVAWHRTEQVGPVAALGFSLAAVVLAGPVVHPWYLLWGIVPLAASATSAVVRRTVAAGSTALVLLVIPGGVQPAPAVLVGALLGVGTGLAIVVLIRQLNGRLTAARPAVAVPHR